MDILACGIAFAIGIIVGTIIILPISKSQTRAQTMGWLRIDHSEPDEPTRMFVELKGVTPDMIAQHKFVMFEVIDESYLSRD